MNELLFCRFAPYNPDPKYLKQKTDKAKELLQEINSIKIDENKMKPREVKALSQVYTSISDQDRISPNNINTMSQKHDENKGKYHIGDYKLIQH